MKTKMFRFFAVAILFAGMTLGTAYTANSTNSFEEPPVPIKLPPPPPPPPPPII